MAGLTALAIGAGVSSLAGGVGSYLANKSASERAEMLQNQALQQWLQVNIPNPEDQKIALQQFVQQGKLAPQLEKAIQADPSAFQKIATNVGYQNAQNNALKQLQDVGNQGGLRLQDRAALQDAQQDSITHERGDRLAIAQQMANRGLGGSGFDVAAQLQAQQSGADRNARSSLDVAGKAQDRALQAIMGAGDMATKLRGQDFDQQSQKAAAEDKINMFNTQNLRDIEHTNTSALNSAQAQNLAEQQRIADQNTKQSNYEQEYNKGLIQQNYDNQLKKTAGITNQYGALAQNAMQQGKNLGNLYSNMGQGASQTFGVLGNYGMQQQQNKAQLDMQQQQNKAQLDMLDEYLKGKKSNQSYSYDDYPSYA